ncbi:metallophosphoesterase [Ascidiimonas aurantiaca]|uniref:metallophosphoesterase n=1 Tax=Ascidiimonas aurantiaca TaxID=1685432 RepID=UPI0030ED80FD
MFTRLRLDKAFKNARILPFNDSSKFILFSDCHRGDNSFADDFANNRNIYFHALKHYYNHGFVYCELGDGDELWENLTFESIFAAHQNIFLLMKKFYDEDRLHIIYGNHDMVYKNRSYVEKHLYSYFEPKTGKTKPLFEGISIDESIILEHTESKQQLFLVHGHQADWWNYTFWRWGRFLVRVLWKPLQVFGIADPTSPAKNYKELVKVEKRFKKWIARNSNQLTIAGHTHRPRFPKPGDPAFFNDGSCVHPRSIIGLEIENGSICLIKWYIEITDEGFLQIVRTILEGPTKLALYKT